MGIFPDSLIQDVLRRLDTAAILRKINYRPEMIQDAGQALKCFCPIHKETIFRTLLVDKKSGHYRCSNFNCSGNAGGDLIDLYSRAAEVSYEQALVELASAYGITVDLSAAEQYLADSLEVAQNYLDLGALKESEEHYERILRFREDCLPALKGLFQIYAATSRRKEHDRVRLKLASVHAAQQQFKEAMLLIDEALAGKPGDEALRRLRIDCLEGDGQIEQAARETLELGDALAESGEIDRALEVYRSAAGYELHNLDINGRVVRLLVAAGRREEAIAACLAQVELSIKTADFEDAAAQLLAALEIDPTREALCIRLAELVAQYQLGATLLARVCDEIRKLLAIRAHGAAGQALDALDRAYGQLPTVRALRADLEDARGNHQEALDLYLQCVDQFYEARNFAQSLAILNRLIAVHPGNVALLSRKANLLRETGAVGEAIPAYLEIIDLFRHSDECENAAAVYQTIIDLEPEKMEYRESQLDLYLTLGLEPVIIQKSLELVEIYRAKSDQNRAIRVLGRAIQRAPLSPELFILHGECLEAASRRAEAAEQFLAATHILFDRRDLAQAQQVVARALRCIPEHIAAREAQADILTGLDSTLQAAGIYNDLAEFYLRERDHDAVIRIVNKLLALQPENPQTLLMLARAYGLAGDLERQLATQTRLIQLYMQGQSYTRATEICEEILNLHEDYTPALEQLIAIAQASRQSGRSVKYLWKLSQVHARAGRRDQEMAILEQVLAGEPTHAAASFRNLEMLTTWSTPQALAEAVSLMVQRHEMAGQVDQALEILLDLARCPQPKPETHAGLARLYRIKGDLESLRAALRTQAELLGRMLRDQEALEVWNELFRLQPEDLTILRMRIEIMLRNNLMDDVIEEYRRLATALVEKRRFEEAEIALFEILGLSPGDLPARNELISILIRTREHERAAEQIEEAAGRLLEEARYAEAIKVFERMFEFDASRDDIYRKIIAIRQRMGDQDGMLAHYGRLLDCLETKESVTEFEQTAQEAIKLYPDSADLRKRLAAFYDYRSRPREAEGVLLTLAVRQMESQQIDEAERTLEKILEMNPGSVPARAHHAQILARRGQTQEALSEFISLTGSLAMASVASQMRPGETPRAFSSGSYEGIQLIKDYTFDTFIVGARNNFAYATAQAVSRAPAKNYNPLFLYSDVGLGKTHLCHAIAHWIIDRHPELKVLYTTTEEFVAELIDAIQNNSITTFRNKHKMLDVLIIDDVQFLSGKERAQEEFFNVFNAIYQAGKQVVLTSDRPPKDITHLEKRLRSRFGAGIIVDIQSPDLETRIAILRHELQVRERENTIDDEIIFYVAEHCESNIRELKGMLNQLLARQDISGQKVDLLTTQHLIEQHMAVEA